MTIIVEDGTGKSDAQSYCTLAFADAWHAARGITVWAPLLDAEREQALVRATAYMVQAYRMRWAGHRVTAAQALDWPRTCAPMPDAAYYAWPTYYAQNVVPMDVQRACAELALSAAAGDLAPNIGRLKESVTIGPITTTYAAGASPSTRYRAVDNMLAPLLRAGGGNSLRVVRA